MKNLLSKKNRSVKDVKAYVIECGQECEKYCSDCCYHTCVNMQSSRLDRDNW